MSPGERSFEVRKMQEVNHFKILRRRINREMKENQYRLTLPLPLGPIIARTSPGAASPLILFKITFVETPAPPPLNVFKSAGVGLAMLLRNSPAFDSVISTVRRSRTQRRRHPEAARAVGEGDVTGADSKSIAAGGGEEKTAAPFEMDVFFSVNMVMAIVAMRESCGKLLWNEGINNKGAKKSKYLILI